MLNIFKNPQLKRLKRLLTFFVFLSFLLNTAISVPLVYAQSPEALPAPGTMIEASPAYNPPIIQGIKLFEDNPLQFDFIIAEGDDLLNDEEFQKESTRMINYFFAALTVPEEQLWVNLSPYEKDRIVPEAFGQTDMGKDLLAQDYLLKQLSASLMYPENDLGEQFWNQIYENATTQLGTTSIPTNTFNKVWIVPEKATIYIHGPNIFVTDSYLKVMLEEDYLALNEDKGNTQHGLGKVSDDDLQKLSDISQKSLKEIIIPAIEKEVNYGKHFSKLRQIYNASILASWYKQNLKNSLLGQEYVDQNKIVGVQIQDKLAKQKIYDQYVDSFKKGVYNFVREDYDPASQQVIPRKYFCGGANIGKKEIQTTTSTTAFQRLKKIFLGKNFKIVSSQGEGASDPVHLKERQTFQMMDGLRKTFYFTAIAFFMSMGGDLPYIYHDAIINFSGNDTYAHRAKMSSLPILMNDHLRGMSQSLLDVHIFMTNLSKETYELIYNAMSPEIKDLLLQDHLADFMPKLDQFSSTHYSQYTQIDPQAVEDFISWKLIERPNHRGELDKVAQALRKLAQKYPAVYAMVEDKIAFLSIDPELSAKMIVDKDGHVKVSPNYLKSNTVITILASLAHEATHKVVKPPFNSGAIGETLAVHMENLVRNGLQHKTSVQEAIDREQGFISHWAPATEIHLEEYFQKLGMSQDEQERIKKNFEEYHLSSQWQPLAMHAVYDDLGLMMGLSAKLIGDSQVTYKGKLTQENESMLNYLLRGMHQYPEQIARSLLLHIYHNFELFWSYGNLRDEIKRMTAVVYDNSGDVRTALLDKIASAESGVASFTNQSFSTVQEYQNKLLPANSFFDRSLAFSTLDSNSLEGIMILRALRPEVDQLYEDLIQETETQKKLPLLFVEMRSIFMYYTNQRITGKIPAQFYEGINRILNVLPADDMDIPYLYRFLRLLNTPEAKRMVAQKIAPHQKGIQDAGQYLKSHTWKEFRRSPFSLVYSQSNGALRRVGAMDAFVQVFPDLMTILDKKLPTLDLNWGDLQLIESLVVHLSQINTLESQEKINQLVVLLEDVHKKLAAQNLRKRAEWVRATIDGITPSGSKKNSPIKPLGIENASAEDFAIATDKETVGGIDLNPNLNTINIEGETFRYNPLINESLLNFEEIDGLKPVILSITPATNFNALFEMNP